MKTIHLMIILLATFFSTSIWAACPQYTANAKENYLECATGQNFNCLNACGPGCLTCRVVVFNTNCNIAGQTCSGRRFQCYTRDCCNVHDNALVRAERLPNAAARLASRINAHASAARNGCGVDEYYGRSYGKDDATCLNFDDLCLRD